MENNFLFNLNPQIEEITSKHNLKIFHDGPITLVVQSENLNNEIKNQVITLAKLLFYDETTLYISEEKEGYLYIFNGSSAFNWHKIAKLLDYSFCLDYFIRIIARHIADSSKTSQDWWKTYQKYDDEFLKMYFNLVIASFLEDEY